MDSDEDYLDDGDLQSDESQEISDEEDELPMDMEHQEAGSADRRDDEAFAYEVLTTDQIVAHMVDCIKDVNAVVQVIMWTTLSVNLFLLKSSISYYGDCHFLLVLLNHSFIQSLKNVMNNN